MMKWVQQIQKQLSSSSTRNLRRFIEITPPSRSFFIRRTSSVVVNEKDDKDHRKNKVNNDDTTTIVSQGMKLLPGVSIAAITMVAGFSIADQLGALLLSSQGVDPLSTASPISGIPVSIILGLGLNNIVSLPANVKPGVTFCTKPILQLGIVCVGMKLSYLELVTTGAWCIPAVAASMAVGLTFVPWFGKQMGLTPKMSSLISVGTTICGVTAISALSPAIKASQQETSVAIANVVAFGTLGMLTYPYLAHAAFTYSEQVGLFLGLAVHDTSQVMGSALTYSAVYGDEVALKTAAVTKLTRNLALGAVIPVLTVKTLAAVEADHTLKEKPKVSFDLIRKNTPNFVLFFVGAASIRSLGDFTLASDLKSALGIMDASQWKWFTSFVGNELGSHYFLGTAMAGIGLSTSASSLKGVGMKPFIVGGVGAGAVALTGFTSAMILGKLL